MGYDRFYGFIGGETNNWYPDLAEDNHYVDQPYLPEDGYHLSKDLADQALRFIRDSKQSEPDKPWYLWFCPGANHAPHHAPQEYIDKYKGKFDDGYEAYREWVLPRMIERGHPARGHRADADQPDAGGHVRAGRRGAAVGHALRRGEAAVLPHGRGLRRLLASTPTPRSAGSSTTSRSPASSTTRSSSTAPTTAPRARAARTARSTRASSSTAGRTTIEDNLPMLDQLGHARRPTTTTRPAGRWRSRRRTGCSSATRTRAASATRWSIHWPKGISAQGEVREQYHHSTDIYPTILDACGIEMPEVVDGAEQSPLAGVSMRYSFDAADAPTQKETQYYEMFGMRGIWHKGWKAVTEHGPISGMSNFETTAGSSSTPTRTAPRRTTSPSSTRKGQGARRPLVRGGQGQQRAAAQRHGGRRRKDLEKFLEMEFKIPVPPSGQYTYYPGTTEVPERTAANVHGVSYKVLAEVELTADDRGRDLRRGLALRRPRAVRQGRQAHLRLQLPRHPAGDADHRRRPGSGRHVVGVEFTKERMGEHHESYGPLKLYVDDRSSPSRRSAR